MVWINETLIQCTTPPLIENIENVTSTQSFAIVWVQVVIIGRPDAIFYFVYSKDLHMVTLDPDNAYISPTV